MLANSREPAILYKGIVKNHAGVIRTKGYKLPSIKKTRFSSVLLRSVVIDLCSPECSGLYLKMVLPESHTRL